MSAVHDLTARNAFGLEFLMRLADVLILGAAGYVASIIHFGAPPDGAAPIHSVLLYFCSAFAFLIFPRFDLYASWRGQPMPSMFVRAATAWAIVLLTGLFFSFLIHHIGAVSRLWLLYWYATGAVFIVVFRVAVYSSLRYLRKKGYNSKRVVIVGYGQTGQEMHRRALRQDWYGYEVKAVYADALDAGNLDDRSIVRIGTLEGVRDYVEANHIHEIWITLPMSASAQLRDLQYLLRNALVDIRWVPDILSMQMLSNKMVDFLGMPAVDLNRPISSGLRSIAKDLFDKLFSTVVLVFSSPLLLAIAACVKYSSPGPVFFRQPRLGLNGRKFMIYKFRTMKLHQEARGAVTQATQDDPRITRVGRFLRRTSLDELPQFINVLMGDMSVVGPRPHALQHNEMYRDMMDLYMLRHRVKPGITGWAQINGHRGETSTVDKMAKRVQFDLYYIQNWSLWLDVQIIAWTAFKGWTGNHAY